MEAGTLRAIATALEAAGLGRPRLEGPELRIVLPGDEALRLRVERDEPGVVLARGFLGLVPLPEFAALAASRYRSSRL